MEKKEETEVKIEPPKDDNTKIDKSYQEVLGSSSEMDPSFVIVLKDIDAIELIVKAVASKTESNLMAQERNTVINTQVQSEERPLTTFESQSLFILQKINDYATRVLSGFQTVREVLRAKSKEVLPAAKLDIHKKRMLHYTQVFSIVEEIIRVLTYPADPSNSNYLEMNTKSTLLFCKKQIDAIFSNIGSKDGQQRLLSKLFYFGKKFIHVFNSINLIKLYKVKNSVDTAISKNVFTKDGRLFITGDCLFPATLHTQELDRISMEFVRRADMNKERRCHAFEEIKSNCLLACGGYVTDCEVYNVETDTWTIIASLNQKRANHSIMSFDERIVYAYGGGWYSRSMLSYEKMLIDDDFSGFWENVDFAAPSDNAPTSFSGCLKLDQSEFLIFGGRGVKSILTKECTIFNAETGTIRAAPYS